jgi:hypothetical protein
VSRYLSDNAAEQSTQRLANLDACLAPVTIRELDQIGLAPTWSCLGGPQGSIAGSSAARVATRQPPRGDQHRPTLAAARALESRGAQAAAA